jgi:hypothetical protein
MSYCSLNARRTTLFNLLRTKDMMKYLRTLAWEDDECVMRVLEILQNETTQDLRQLYLRCHEWRKDIRKLILHALCILAKCTVDESTHELSIPWISENADCSVTFYKSDISWTGFLQDTRDSSTFGLLSNKCLSFKQPGGRICGQHSGSPVLQTSLRVNKSMAENFMHLKQYGSGEYYWSIAAIRKKLRFPLGSQGNLTVVCLVGKRAALLMEWSSEAETKTFVKRALRWNGGKHHQEFIRANWNAKDRPIHIFIMAKYQVPGIPKRYRKHRHRKSDTPEDYYLPGPSVPQITYKPQNASAGSSPSRRGMQIFRVESESSAPISIPRSSSSQSQYNEEISMDITSDNGNALSVRNRWTWDRNYKQWRKHVYKDGELEYTMWTRNPDLDDG